MGVTDGGHLLRGARGAAGHQRRQQEAGLGRGQPTTFRTANGTRPGRIVSDVAVSAGGARVPAVRVGVGLSGMGPDEALLGQSFLSRFEVNINGPQMIMRPRQP